MKFPERHALPRAFGVGRRPTTRHHRHGQTARCERPSGTRAHAFFDFSLPGCDVPDMAMSLRADAMIGSYIIYEGEQNDDAYRAWHFDAMKALEPFTVGQYWGTPTRPTAR